MVTSEYAPYVFKGENGKVTGLMPELVSAALPLHNENISFVIVPWKRAETMVAKGQATAAFPFSRNEERRERFVFSDKVIDFQPALFYLKKNFPNGFQWRSIPQLKPYRIASVNGYAPNPYFAQFQIPTIIVNEELGAMTMINGNRADFFLLDSRVGWHLIRENFAVQQSNFAHSTTDAIGGKYYLMFGKDNPDGHQILKSFNEGLAAIKASGKFQEIVSQY